MHFIELRLLLTLTPDVPLSSSSHPKVRGQDNQTDPSPFEYPGHCDSMDGLSSRHESRVPGPLLILSPCSFQAMLVFLQ